MRGILSGNEIMAAPHVTHWEASNPPTEELVTEILSRQGMDPVSWSNGPGDTYFPHKHNYLKVIYVVRGSITFNLPGLKQKLELKTGDRMELPANIVHSAEVGPEGVLCVEGHLG